MCDQTAVSVGVSFSLFRPHITMNSRNQFLLSGMLMFLMFIGARARAIPDFYTDDDLDAWHKFGLRSFYGPWSVVARKPNGDFVSYADYGARVPSDFRPISGEAVDDDNDDGDDDNEDDSSRGNSRDDRPERQYPSKYATGLSDFAAGYGLTPYGLAVFSNGVQTPETAINGSPFDQTELENNAITLNSTTDLEHLIKSVDGKSTNKQSKRETLELIGIVGVISDKGENFSEDDSVTLASTDTDTTTENEDNQTTDIDQSLDATS